MRTKYIQNVNYILQLLDGKGDIKEARLAIINLIESHLQALKEPLGYWEKQHLANAVASLAWNINSIHQPTTAWLKLCLVNVEKALVPVSQRGEDLTQRDKQLESLTYTQLIEDIKTLRQLC